ncbi:MULTISPECIES: SDR family oxidoreductase [unclassified Coleofasciculus]|jgi:short-subunit dehydrogenase|uniref:SDR family oxidoreductase n=1 Tax=Cyanophyceae TaxID=3028117 RepID=UPI00168610CB|nr:MULTISPECIES: SDR family oxidoreductase [unclassified Coleofasciculus]MBD1881089.1 SDR family oxidoreductase [Coleofasciculus sp. FACHB-T130]MBD1889830.1 SDR family oxidoreductase [Coleofasciculus sp. FACHB-SPT9]MBD1897818.1 SDR family oxidoreductase [Coleofasciculus sp. FACHB-129]MBD2086906.1 SDR family oxidoreductase [Coleofasciculus sp. FACHB-542]MBD2541063.1 SDR family oxidoreductase [Coleofasciculus sp. FACHB-SPT36]
MTSPIERRALITGASSGIGKATALAFAKAGFHVALVSRSESKLEAVAEAARKTGVTAKAYALDLADIEQVREKVAAIADSFGSIDVLVNNAGMGYTGEIMSTPLSEWQQVIDLNLTSAFQCIQGILPSMRDRGSGIIINVASIAGQQPFPGWGAYNVSKAALIALSKTLAAEERAKGIRVVTISPGAVNTPIWDTETVQVELNRSAMLTPEIVAQSILHMALVPEQAVIEELTLMPNAGVL